MKTEKLVRNCPVKIKFECPKFWKELEATQMKGVRFCSSCDRNVYFCNTDEETIARARKGDCIAREIPSQEELPMDFMGQVEVQPEETSEQEKAYAWTVRENAIHEAISRKNPEKHCFSCGYPTSEYRKSCKVCGVEFDDVKVWPRRD